MEKNREHTGNKFTGNIYADCKLPGQQNSQRRMTHHPAGKSRCLPERATTFTTASRLSLGSLGALLTLVPTVHHLRRLRVRPLGEESLN